MLEYKEDWTEGKRPDFETRPVNAEKVTNVQEVGQEFAQLYKMIYAEKILPTVLKRFVCGHK